MHYGSAAMCVAGLGYGFAQPMSTRLGLKAFYAASVGALASSLTALTMAEANAGGEDLDNPATYWARLFFMVSEYATFLSGVVAVGYPRVAASNVMK